MSNDDTPPHGIPRPENDEDWANPHGIPRPVIPKHLQQHQFDHKKKTKDY